MSRENVAERKKLPVLKLAAVAVAVLVAAALVLRGVDVRGWMDRGVDVVRAAGPAAFFAGMALLPALPVPTTAFTLTAGSAFGERLGMPLVVGLSVAAITFNLLFTYVLARWLLRPWAEKLMARLGYRLPALAAGDMTDLTIVVRVTPGTPFFVQNYLLGLANVPLGKYLLISCLAQAFYTPAFVLFGDALLHGRGRMALLATSLLVIAIVATHWARKHYGKKEDPRTKLQAPAKDQ
ncbi:MAG TPA: VTT domain-containing protein [Opitutus sp.]|nr:VTT domain-containing protein [Opitutus sp.]